MTARRFAFLVLLAITICVATVSLWIPVFIYRPTRLENPDPKSWALAGMRLVEIPSAAGAVLSGWWAAPTSSHSPIILIVHGRSGNVSTRAEIAKRLIAGGFSVLMFDYRGYGRSTGRPSERGLTEDAGAAYDWLRRQGARPDQIIVVGQSLGDAPAAQLSASRPVKAVVLVSPFTSLPGAASDSAPWLPVRLLPWSQNRFEVASSVARLYVPLVLVVSKGDGLVPFANSQRLAALAPGAHWLEADELHHNGLLAGVTLDGRRSRALMELDGAPAARPRRSRLRTAHWIDRRPAAPARVRRSEIWRQISDNPRSV